MPNTFGNKPLIEKLTIGFSVFSLLLLVAGLTTFTFQAVRSGVVFNPNSQARILEDTGFGEKEFSGNPNYEIDIEKETQDYYENLRDSVEERANTSGGDTTSGEINKEDYDDCMRAYGNKSLCEGAATNALPKTGSTTTSGYDKEDYDDCMKAYSNKTLCEAAAKYAQPANTTTSQLVKDDYDDCMKKYNSKVLCQYAATTAGPSLSKVYADCMKTGSFTRYECLEIQKEYDKTGKVPNLGGTTPTTGTTTSPTTPTIPTTGTSNLPTEGIGCSNKVSTASCFCSVSTCFWNDSQNHTYSIPRSQQANLDALISGLAQYGVLHESYAQLSIDWNKDGKPDIPLSFLFYESTQQLLGALQQKYSPSATPLPAYLPTAVPIPNPTIAPASSPAASGAPGLPNIPGGIPSLTFYSQKDPAWGNLLIGPDNVPFYTVGCGETILASLLASYVDPSWDPMKAYDTFWKDNPDRNDGWSSIYFLADILAEYGFNPTEDRKDWDIFGQIISEGNLGLFYGVFGPNRTPHLSLITGYYKVANGLGHFILQDPYIDGGGANGKLDCVGSGGKYTCTTLTGEKVAFDFLGKYVITPPNK